MKRGAALVLPTLLVAETALAAPNVAMADLSGVILSLALVVGFIFAAAWVVRRMPLGLGRSNGPLKVLAALPLGPREVEEVHPPSSRVGRSPSRMLN